MVTDPNKEIVEKMEYDIEDSKECYLEKRYSGSRPVLRLIGEKDKYGNAHGDVEIYYVNGDHFCGTFNHGRKTGEGVESLKNGDTTTGIFTDGYLDGFVSETLEEDKTREVYYRHGVRHGLYREFGHAKQFLAFGRFKNGKKVGTHWCWSRGDSFLVGPVDENNKPDGDNMFFIYPDLTTTLIGHFSHGKMTGGIIVSLIGVNLDHAIPIPVVMESDCSTSYSYEPAGSICISRSPMLRDPYEKRYVYVKDSAVPFAGEGLWAKRGIKTGQVCALFNGVRQHHLWGQVDLPWSDYRISCEQGLDLDIYPEHVSTDNYRATLAHKTCHSFTPNCGFDQFWHPRFGLIMSIVANSDILAGEEISASYNYKLDDAPEWYLEQWHAHLRNDI